MQAFRISGSYRNEIEADDEAIASPLHGIRRVERLVTRRPHGGISFLTLDQAIQYMVSLLYAGFSAFSPKAEKRLAEIARNNLIRARYAEGVSGPDLAKQFGLSTARIYQILRGKRK
jgi:hypothetical protein